MSSPAPDLGLARLFLQALGAWPGSPCWVSGAEDKGTETAGSGEESSRLPLHLRSLSLQNKAKEDFDQAIGWCVSLITDYRVRLGMWDLHGIRQREWAGTADPPLQTL